MNNFVSIALNDSLDLISRFSKEQKNIDQINEAINIFSCSIKEEGKLLACGNGGSMCDSMHFVQELTGRYRKDRNPIAAISMGDPSHLTCVANDFGYEYVFERNVRAWGKKGDSLLAISTSGKSKNVIHAVNEAKKLGIKTVGLLGKDGGELKDLVDVPIIVSHKLTDRIQEIHIKIIHTFIEGIERAIYPESYTS
jgi:D-sedoheptulose 7-phosphate isomerase